MTDALARIITFPMGVVIAREAIDSPWAEHIWRPVSVFLNAEPITAWRLLRQTETQQHYHAATLDLELHRKETEGYATNLASDEPRIFVVLRDTSALGGDPPMQVHLITASAFDIQAYGHTSEEMVGSVPMPDDVFDLVAAFIEAHHVDEPFVKRKRKQFHEEEVHQFGQEPIHIVRERMRARQQANAASRARGKPDGGGSRS